MIFTSLFILLSIVIILIVKLDKKFNEIIFRQFACERLLKVKYVSDDLMKLVNFTYFILPKILFAVQTYLLLKIAIEQNSQYLMFLFAILLVVEYYGYQKIKSNKQNLDNIFNRHTSNSISLSFSQYRKYYRIVRLLFKENCILNLYYWVLQFTHNNIVVIVNEEVYLKIEFFGRETKFIYFNPEINNIINVKTFYSYNDILKYLRGVNV